MPDYLAARVARAARALVEGQEARVLALQTRRHVREVGIEREVHERAPAEQEVRRRSLAVLADRVIDGLARVAVLQLGCRCGNAVDEQHEVDAVTALGIEAHLAHDPKPVVLIEDARVGSTSRSGSKNARRSATPFSVSPPRSTAIVPRLSSCAATRRNRLMRRSCAEPASSTSLSHAWPCVSRMNAMRSSGTGRAPRRSFGAPWGRRPCPHPAIHPCWSAHGR